MLCGGPGPLEVAMAEAHVDEPSEKVGLEAEEGKFRSKETFGTIPEFMMSLQRGRDKGLAKSSDRKGIVSEE